MILNHFGAVFLRGGHLKSVDRFHSFGCFLFRRPFQQGSTIFRVKGVRVYDVVRDGGGRFAKHVINDSIQGNIADREHVLIAVLLAGFAGHQLETVTSIFAQDTDILNQTSTVDLAMIDSELRALQGELATQVKLNLKTGIDDTIYGEEYKRIANRMEKLKNKRSSVTVAEIGVRKLLAECGR